MKSICLGSAMWGWSVDKEEAFKLLDRFYSHGGRYVDTARNYPINGKAEDFLLSSKIISEWCKTHSITDLRIIHKIGSLRNENTPDNDLSKSSLYEHRDEALKLYGENLHCLMIHWDNRTDSANEIRETCDFLIETRDHYRIVPGLSGIKNVPAYQKNLSSMMQDVVIEAKNNLLHDGVSHYRNLLNLGAKIFAYGISVSGLKLDKSEYHKRSYVSLSRGSDYHDKYFTDELKSEYDRMKENYPFIRNFYHASIVFTELNKDLYGYLIGPSSLKQLNDIIDFRELFLKSQAGA